METVIFALKRSLFCQTLKLNVFIKPVAHREIKQNCRRSWLRFCRRSTIFLLFQFQDVGTSETVSGCFSVLFQFYFRDVPTPEIKQNFVSFQPITGSIV